MATTKVATGWGIIFPFSVVLIIMLVTWSGPAAPFGDGVGGGFTMLAAAALGLYLMITGLAERKRLGASKRELW